MRDKAESSTEAKLIIEIILVVKGRRGKNREAVGGAEP